MYNEGMKIISEKTKLKMRLAKLGKKRPKEVVEKIRLSTIKAMADPEIKLKMRMAKLGKIGNKKGYKYTEEQIKKLSESHIGQKAWNKGLKGCYKQSLETIEKRVSKMRGKNNPAWKGGKTPINVGIRMSQEWKNWRDKVFERDNYTCQKYKIRGDKLHPHHIKNFADYPELRFEVGNGITLSKKAHNEFHKIYGKKNNTLEQLQEFIKG